MTTTSDRAFRLLLCALGVWSLLAYLTIVVPLDRAVPAMNAWQLAVPLTVISFFGTSAIVAWLDKHHRPALMNLTLLSMTLFIGFLVIDVGSTAYFNLEEHRRPDTDAGRDLDEHAWDGELMPNAYYPTEANFELYKPLERKRGYAYGEHYYPGLLKHAVIRDSVLRLEEVDFAIDKYGLRNTSPPEQSRVFALGDSFCFGYHMAQQATFEALLGSKLGEPVYNMGVSGSSPLEQLSLLEYFLDKYPTHFAPKRLLWLFYEGNDLEDSYVPKRTKSEQGGWLFRGLKGTILEVVRDLPARLRKQSLLRRVAEGKVSLRVSHENKSLSSHFMWDGDRLAYPLYHSPRFGYRLFRFHNLERATKPLSYVLNHPNRPRLDDTFRRMRDLSRQRGFSVTVVIVPTDVRLYKNAFEDLPPVSDEPHVIDYVKQLAESVGFKSLDLNELMAPQAAQELLYHRDDTHWNQRGHEVVADLLARHAF